MSKMLDDSNGRMYGPTPRSKGQSAPRAFRVNTPPNVLRQAYRSAGPHDWLLQSNLAEHPMTPENVLGNLYNGAKNYDITLLRLLARNPRTPQHLLSNMTERRARSTLNPRFFHILLSKNPSTPTRALRYMSNKYKSKKYKSDKIITNAVNSQVKKRLGRLQREKNRTWDVIGLKTGVSGDSLRPNTRTFPPNVAKLDKSNEPKPRSNSRHTGRYDLNNIGASGAFAWWRRWRPWG